MADLDSRTNMEDRMKPQGKDKLFVLGQEENQTTTLANGLSDDVEWSLIKVLRRNKDLFVWTSEDIPWTYPIVMSHKLTLFTEAHPVTQNKHRLGEEKGKAIEVKIKKLWETRFLRGHIYHLVGQHRDDE